jgi:hypothetical protein
MKKKKGFPCVYHKPSEHPTINLVNFLTNKWSSFKDHRFLGFIPTHKDCVNSLVLDGVNYIACHVFFRDEEYLDDDKDFKEKPYILMFAGNDDLSYGKRFKTLLEALTFFEETDVFTKHINDMCSGYN